VVSCLRASVWIT